MSPVCYPAALRDISTYGNMFTLFLTSPIKALLFLSDVREIDQELWNHVKLFMNDTEEIIAAMLESSVELRNQH